MPARLTSIQVYPIKSFDPVDLHEATVTEGAGIAGDREFVFVDEGGRVQNAKRCGERIIPVRARYALADRTVEMQAGGEAARFGLDRDRPALEAWIGARLGRRVLLRQDAAKGFQDDPEASGPTVVGSASLAAVADWFGFAIEEARRRIRANLEIAGLEPFEEDRLFGPPGRPRPFRIGDVTLLGVNPCARCTVPAMDSRNGVTGDEHFARKFAEFRKRHGRPDTALDLYQGHYRLAVNTRLAAAQGGKTLRIGDELHGSGTTAEDTGRSGGLA